jgi:hypothetical protein
MQTRNASSFVELSFVFNPSFCWKFLNDMLETPAPVATFHYHVGGGLLSDREMALSCPSPVSPSRCYGLLAAVSFYSFISLRDSPFSSRLTYVRLYKSMFTSKKGTSLRNHVMFVLWRLYISFKQREVLQYVFLYCIMYIVTMNSRLNEAWCKTT